VKRFAVICVACLCAGHALAAQPTQADCDDPAAYTVLEPAKSKAADARAYWLDGETIAWPGGAPGAYRLASTGRATIALTPASTPIPDALKYIGDAITLRIPPGTDVRALLRTDVTIERLDARGKVIDRTHLQSAAALDALYADAAEQRVLGTAGLEFDNIPFVVWAPTARNVALCLYDTPRGPSREISQMARDDKSGAWADSVPEIPGPRYYLYLVDIDVPGIGLVRNRVTDPYSQALSADGARSFFVQKGRDDTPEYWSFDRAPQRRSDVIYELHVRDFSRDDPSVPAEHRGKYLAFTDTQSNGMRHLHALVDAGVTDVHLLPVFDFASVPERGCDPNGDASHDCFNWGYEPVHFNAPEGSYATQPDGAERLYEFRQMVMALHTAGLRVGMDVVYNHTTASGQAANSVLDRIVPGYYHRLDANGAVTNSTCCANTATEHRMMGKLMRDSVVQWATDFHIDSFRFDLMGHQPRAVMEDLQRALKQATGRDIPLIGEGWNFGEVADGKRFVQASQLSLNGTGIGTFNDRARDAVRGGGPGDRAPTLADAKGWISGGADAHSADLVRVGLAGTLRDYELPSGTPLSKVDYNGQPAGYASQPSEVVNYVENHDNQTLFDIGAWKLPRDTTPAERARVQLLGAAVVAFSQGTAYYHAGIDVLRSKSLDRNSYDSGDAFNRLDWTYQDNGFGVGLPPANDNGVDYAAMRPLLADAARIKPAPADIAWMRDAFRDLLRIRRSSGLFHLGTTDEVRARLTFPDTGTPEVIAGKLDGRNNLDPSFVALHYFLNASTQTRSIVLPDERGVAWELHPVHMAPDAADKRAREARFDRATGRFTLPPRTAIVFVLRTSTLPPPQSIELPANLSGTSELVTIEIQLPPGYEHQGKQRYPVLYMDDGQDIAAVHAGETLERLYRERTIRPFILVAIRMPKDRMAAYGLADRVGGSSLVANTKYGPIGVQAQAYSEWLVQTLVPYIDAHLRTQPNPQGRAILGWSLGGINAFSLGWNYPDVFGRVGAFSPSFWMPAEAKTPTQRIAPMLVERGKTPPGFRAYFAVGTAEETDDRDNDGVIDVVDDAQDLAAQLRAKGAKEVKVVPLENGRHRQTSWAAMLPGFLEWAFGR
jgi:pullulanase